MPFGLPVNQDKRGILSSNFDNTFNTLYPAGNKPAGGASAYSITGTGFGTKDATTPKFEDFEGQPVGPVSANFNDIIAYNFSGLEIVDTEALSQSRSLKNDFSVHEFPQAHVILSGTRKKIYACAHIRYDGLSGEVWKHGRAGANTVYSGVPRFSTEYTSAAGSSAPTTLSSIVATSNGYETSSGDDTANAVLSDAYVPATTLFYEFEMECGDIDVANGNFYERISNVPTTTFENRPYLTTANSALPTWFLTPLNGHANSTVSLAMIIDNLYVDESRARVVMTDAAVYANSTKFAVQPIETYSDTEVVATRKRQVFEIFETAYLHLFDDNGVLVHSSNSFLVEED